eukprot:9158075-Alexandrium_andersonii.AAC.1
MPTHVERRLDAGRAVYSLDESENESVFVEPSQEGFEDARVVCPDNDTWACPEGYGPDGARAQFRVRTPEANSEESEYRDATTGAVLGRKLVEEARAEEI